jgi:hypothetical protein
MPSAGDDQGQGTPAESRSGRSAAITGGVWGVVLAGFAQTLDEPGKGIIAVLAPAFGALVQSIWPPIKAGITWTFDQFVLDFKQWVYRRRIRNRIRVLEDQERGTTDRELKAKLKDSIRALKLAQIDVIVEGAKPNSPEPPTPPTQGG